VHLNPTASSDTEGQLWYNSGIGKFKIVEAGTAAWSSGTAMNNGRSTPVGDGTQTAAIMTGGNPTSYTEIYNGTTWTEVLDLNAPRSKAASSMQGSTTASLVYGGSPNPGSPSTHTDETELWNGTSWTEVLDLNVSRRTPTGGGSTTAAIANTGQTSPTTYMDESEEYNGTSWVVGNTLNTGRNAASGAGTQTAAMVFGGRIPAATALTEIYNGTSWTEVNSLNLARNEAAGFGVQTGAIFVGGAVSPYGQTEQWNGTSWTEVADLATGRYGLGGTGTSSLGLIGAGEPLLTSVEEWNDPAYSAKTVTVS